MAVTLEQFVEHLVQSGLMSADEVSAFEESRSPQKRPQDAQTLARELVAAGKLTKYQAQLIYQGRPKGLVFGEYTVLDKLGQGGMGMVLKARHRRLGRVVAVKVLPAAAMKSPDAVKRFYREAAAAGRLIHQNIVTAYDAAESEGIHYLAMEYVDGKDLASVVRERGPLEVKQAIHCILQAAKGLEYAHGEGVIHRDIKPGNLLLDRKGNVKILDMGLARVALAGGDEPSSERLTQSGQVMGTCDYMAPEQAEDTRKADQRSDVYSLGCTLYRLLTGKVPYEGDSLVQLLLAHRDAPIPSLRAARPDVPESVDIIFRRMVAKRPEDRQQSMTEVIADLEGFLAGASPPPLPESWAGDSESGSLLQNLSFLQETTPQPGAVATRQAAKAAAEDTFRHRAHPHTATGIYPKLASLVGQRKPLAVGLAVALGSAAVVVLLGVIVITLRGHGGRDTTIRVPEGSDVSIARDGKVDVKLPDEKRTSAREPTAAPVAPSSPQTPSSSRPAAEPAAQGDWLELFNGRDLTGWGVVGDQKWKVEDGILKTDKNGRGWLMTDEDYADFELELEYRMSESGNSGIFLRAWPEGDPGGGQFVEIQLLDDDAPKFRNLSPKTKNGAVFGMVAPSSAPNAPAGQWNAVRIREQGRRLHVAFNGIQVIDANLDDYSAMSGRFSGLTRSSGRIGLQLMDGPVEFRKLRARRLSAGSTSSGEESIRHFGYYVWDGPPELVSEIAPYTNVVIDVSWLRKGAGVIEAAQKAGRQVVPVVFGRERAGAEERLFPVIEKCRPAIPAVYWADTGEVGYSRDQVDGFGRVLKQRFPGIQLWVSYFNPSPNVPGFEIADAVDVVILSGLTGDSPQSVGSKIDAVLPAWKEKAGNRTIILAWLAHTGPPPGLVPKCARGTLRAWVEAARKHRLAGAIFASYGDCKERGTVGIRTRPELVDEVKRCSQELGVGPDAAPR